MSNQDFEAVPHLIRLQLKALTGLQNQLRDHNDRLIRIENKLDYMSTRLERPNNDRQE